MAECSPVITSKTEIPGAVRRAVGRAGQAHQPGHALHQQVVAGQPRAAAGAEAADRAVDDAVVAGAHGVVVQAEPCRPPGLKFWMNTSARADSSCATLKVVRSFRSKAIDRLLRLTAR